MKNKLLFIVLAMLFILSASLVGCENEGQTEDKTTGVVDKTPSATEATIKLNYKNISMYDGEEFTFLVHKIKGLLQLDITKKLEQDISEWDKNYQDNAYISCSLINNDNLSLTPGEFLTLGFQNITKDHILALNNKDMFFKSK